MAFFFFFLHFLSFNFAYDTKQNQHSLFIFDGVGAWNYFTCSAKWSAWLLDKWTFCHQNHFLVTLSLFSLINNIWSYLEFYISFCKDLWQQLVIICQIQATEEHTTNFVFRMLFFQSLFLVEISCDWHYFRFHFGSLLYITEDLWVWIITWYQQLPFSYFEVHLYWDIPMTGRYKMGEKWLEICYFFFPIL